MDTLARLPSGFWEWVGRTQARLLMLEYEGVVAPRGLDREQVLPHPRIYALLRKVAELPKTSVAIVSSWPARDLARFLPGLPIDLVGESGWELRARTGLLIEHPVPPPQARSLADAAASARALGLGAAVTARRGSVVLDTRRLSLASTQEVERRCLAAWAGLARRGELRLSQLDGRLELAASGRDQGIAVRELIAAAPPATACVYLGGDPIDGDALRAAQASGFGLCLESAASTANASDRGEDVAVFLRCWLVATSPAKEVGA
ncbi:MAG: hypothetical protein U1E76_28525 [Planctomycetota bacterium]